MCTISSAFALSLKNGQLHTAHILHPSLQLHLGRSSHPLSYHIPDITASGKIKFCQCQSTALHQLAHGHLGCMDLCEDLTEAGRKGV